MSTDTLQLPGLKELEAERAARKAAEQDARYWKQMAELWQQRAWRWQQRTRQWQQQAELWERAKLNGRTIKHFKGECQRYKALYWRNKTNNEQGK